MKTVSVEYKKGVALKGLLYEPSDEIKSMQNRPAVVVVPGGGYNCCSDREADPIASYFFGRGFQVFIFTYSLGEQAVFPTPAVELSVAIKDIRAHAEEWHVIPEQIALCGFSAGGHLCATLGTEWNLPEIAEKSNCPNGENKPNALVLGYPVINTRSWMRGEVDRLAGSRDRAEAVHLLNTDEQVGPHTPPAFVFHTYADSVVAVEDTLSFITAMAKHDRLFEAHIFPTGEHGAATGDATTDFDEPEVAAWMPMASAFLWRLFGRKDLHPINLTPHRAHPVKE